VVEERVLVEKCLALLDFIKKLGRNIPIFSKKHRYVSVSYDKLLKHIARDLISNNLCSSEDECRALLWKCFRNLFENCVSFKIMKLLMQILNVRAVPAEILDLMKEEARTVGSSGGTCIRHVVKYSLKSWKVLSKYLIFG